MAYPGNMNLYFNQAAFGEAFAHAEYVSPYLKFYNEDGELIEQVEIGGSGAESDPIFSASPSATITQAMIDQWNSGVGSETDPVFTASPAASITAADLTKIQSTYESRIATLESQVNELTNTVNRLDNTLSDSIQTDG